MSRRGRLGFVAACLVVFGLLAALITWRHDPSRQKDAGHGHRGPGGDPAGPVDLVDLRAAGQLQARFNADQGMPRLVLALAPT